jgi:hypothetical protein
MHRQHDWYTHYYIPHYTHHYTYHYTRHYTHHYSKGGSVKQQRSPHLHERPCWAEGVHPHNVVGDEALQ